MNKKFAILTVTLVAVLSGRDKAAQRPVTSTLGVCI
jgi:hypothetical protein